MRGRLSQGLGSMALLDTRGRRGNVDGDLSVGRSVGQLLVRSLAGPSANGLWVIRLADWVRQVLPRFCG